MKASAINNKDEKKIKHPLFSNLCLENQAFIHKKNKEFSFTQQNLSQLLEWTTDFEMWNIGLLESIWDESSVEKLEGKFRQKKIIDVIRSFWNELKESSPDYHLKLHPDIPQKDTHFSSNPSPETILGNCPVFSDQTRCCNLQTLDAVLNCSYGCTYCSIQSFYNNEAIIFHENLAEKLNAIPIDPNKTYHIGTGQSSDSLLWGNKNNLLSDLFSWVKSKPNIILELKTKSANVDYLLQNEVPPNVIITWSMNANTIIKNEELKTASLVQRIDAAQKVAQKGILIGFHLHPIVLFKGWEREYKELATKLVNDFDPKDIALLSLGTLTFIKPVIKELRKNKQSSKILQMPLENAAGKLSYPLERKKEFFKIVYNLFKPWHGKVFTYLCMEDQSLWKDIFGFEYPDNHTFETDMKKAYLEKIGQRISS